MSTACQTDIWIRCDASNRIGFGHVRRCLSLARALNGQGLKSGFLTKYPEEVKGIIGSEGFEVTRVEDKRSEVDQIAALQAPVVLDLLGISESYQRDLYDRGVDFLTIDGSGRTPCWGKALLDPTVCEPEAKTSSELLRRDGAKIFRGPKYALLEFNLSNDRPETQANKVLVTMGGGDDRGGIVFVLRSLNGVDRELEITIQCLGNNPNLERIEREAAANSHRVSVVKDQPVLNEAAASSALAIVAGGITCYELAMMGVPFLICPIADNQIRSGRAWEAMGIGVFAGPIEDLSEAQLAQVFDDLLDRPEQLQSMRELGLRSCDGQGASRVSKEIASWIEFS